MSMDLNFTAACNFLQERNLFFTLEEQAVLKQHTRSEQIPKHSIIMQQGQPVPKLYFLNEGIVRLTREHNGELYTLGIVSSKEFVSTPLYLVNQKDSSCSLEALTDLDVLYWDRQDLLNLRKIIPKMHEMEMALMDRVLTWVQDNQISALCLSAEERYQKLMDEQPELINRIPLKYIASYLSIHQDSLSRIRKSAVKLNKT